MLKTVAGCGEQRTDRQIQLYIYYIISSTFPLSMSNIQKPFRKYSQWPLHLADNLHSKFLFVTLSQMQQNYIDYINTEHKY